MPKCSSLVLVTAAAALCLFLPDFSLAEEPVRVILDTDMAGDCDDAGALAVLHALADRGEAEILAVVTNGEEWHESSAAAVDAINTYYGRPDVPIGTYKSGGTAFRKRSPFTPALRDEFPQNMPHDRKAPDAVAVCRKVLAQQADRSVTYVSVGMLSNMADLLRSPPDDISDLSGKQLVERKVKLAVVMGGQYPKETRESEANFSRHAAATKYAVENWPTPIVFTGFEVGRPIITGKELQKTPVINPVRRAYELRPYLGRASLSGGKPSYDQTAVLFAIRGPGKLWHLVRGRNVIEDARNARNHWEPSATGPHAYLVNAAKPDEIAQVIGLLMAQPPKRQK